MANLLDTIRQNSQAIAGQPAANTDQTQQVGNLLRAKSGTAATGGDFAGSNLGEQQAVSQTQNTLQNVIQPQNQVTQAGLAQQSAAQTQQANIQKGQIAQANRANTIQTQLQTNSILQQYEQGKGQLNLDENTAAANQVATNLRLQNQKYVDQLNNAAAKDRIDSGNNFKIALEQSILGDNTQLLQTKLGNQSILDANNTDFQRAMADMDAGFAEQLLSNQLAGARQAAIYGGAGAVVTGGIAGAGAASRSNPSTTSSTSPAAAADENASDLGGAANNDMTGAIA